MQKLPLPFQKRGVNTFLLNETSATWVYKDGNTSKNYSDDIFTEGLLTYSQLQFYLRKKVVFILGDEILPKKYRYKHKLGILLRLHLFK